MRLKVGVEVPVAERAALVLQLNRIVPACPTRGMVSGVKAMQPLVTLTAGESEALTRAKAEKSEIVTTTRPSRILLVKRVWTVKVQPLRPRRS